ncbi:PAS domain S-box [Clostridium putrefaciens]|uniref:HTH-type transcriptional regulatory protein TyrR n=1 Tax=Clostridium putrefaciens TaxID=99675 RepID=A0A381J3X4_9CLOT|nr:sigma 54-interacting transcriptional regulator [Clostridium putrefaciens]SUY45445.1 PAS domain S-box [Clostridium putrefaciens]
MFFLDSVSHIDKESNKKIKDVALDASSDGILISDNKGNIVYVNNAYENITGLKKDEVTGKNLNKLLKDKIFNVAVSLAVLEKGEVVSTIHKYVTGKSALTTASPIYDATNNIVGVICNTRNISQLITLRNELVETKKLTERYSNEIQRLREIHMEYEGIIFKSKIMKDMLELLSKVALFDSTILIYGESGTGKEVLAKFIHKESNRRVGPFIKVNCAAIPNELFESELFGYESGSFTGASQKGKPGLFELANEGTILLDEVGELPLSVQCKLLRVIQEREVSRVGGHRGIKLNVRILAATNRNLLQEIKKGNFREDLFFRLNVIPITVPPLRERREDIPGLISYFLENLNRKYKKNITISDEVINLMMSYSWKGNIRELQNLIEYLFIINPNDEICIEQLPTKLLAEQLILNNKGDSSKLKDMMYIIEKNIIISTLKNHSSMRKAANDLGVDVSTLSRKIKRYGIDTFYIK